MSKKELDEVAAAWDVEICRRINEVKAGTAQLLDLDEVLSRARARLAKEFAGKK